MKTLLTFLLCLSVWALGAEPLRVANRTPALDEIGYLPADGSSVSFNPPSFAWLHEAPAKIYLLQWAQQADFKNATSISNLWLNCYTHNSLLPAGDYAWRYRFTDKDGHQSEWSQVRQFSIQTNAVPFPMPSVTERRNLIPKGHPRLFVRPEDLPRLRALANGAEAERFKLLRKAADRLCRSTPLSEPTKRGSANNKKDIEALQEWWPNRERALAACMEAETVAFVYLITGDPKYGKSARQRVLALAKWDPNGPTNFKINCEAAKPMLHRISRAYDWAYDMFSPQDRVFIQQAITRRIQQAWDSGEVGRGVGHINRPLNSHGNRTWHKIGESGIVFLDEIPQAETWLDYALNKFYACYPVWSDDDGGWHEGLAYLGGYMTKAVWWLQAAQSALQIDGFKKPFFSKLGDFPIYMAPPGSPNMGFGDLSYRPDTLRHWGGFMDYFVRMSAAHDASHAPYWRWWCEQWGMKSETGIFGFLYAASLPATPLAKTPQDLPQSKVFRGVGLASLHTSLLHSSNDVHFLLKADPFGSQSHGHNPQNTFQLNAFGDALLTTCVYRDWHGTEFHEKWVHQTIAHNGILVNGQGQLPHSAKAQAQITESQLTKEWDYVVGDAVEAYEGRLTRCLRRVLFIKPDLIVILDDLAAPAPTQFQLMLHALAPFKKSNKTNLTWHVQQPHAGVSVQYLSPTPLSFKQWDGFKPAPLKGNFANQWHLEAATTNKQCELGMLTVLAPHRGIKAPAIKTTRLETETAIGARIVLNGRTHVVAFRKTGVTGPAEFDGAYFDGPVLLGAH